MNLILENKKELLKNIKKYSKLSEKINEVFGGPSTYFHNECIKEGKNNYLSSRHIELIYATLTSWGMHRMGPNKTKLTNFDVFTTSIHKNKKILLELKKEKLKTTNLENIKNKIKTIFDSLKISISNSKLVSHSKTMHHLLWNLIPPMDGNFTIRFFYYRKKDFLTNSKKGKIKFKTISRFKKEEEFQMFWEILCEMQDIVKQAKFDFNVNQVNFNTSIPKIVDNLIMGYVKDAKREYLKS